MSDILEVDGLTITTHDGRALVRDLDLTVPAGGRAALIGESGSGKSLTSLAVMGLLPDMLVARGRIRVAGHEMVGARDRDASRVRGRDVGIVFQEPLTALDPLAPLGRQLGEAVRRAARRRGDEHGRAATRRAVLDALARVSLREPERIARAYPHEVSGGQRQRVAIAMALAARPALLLLDEPTTALDVSIQAEILALLDELTAREGTSTLFVSHDLAVVARMADEAVVLRRGAAVERGPIDRILAEPREEYTRTLVNAARELDAALDLGEAP